MLRAEFGPPVFERFPKQWDGQVAAVRFRPECSRGVKNSLLRQARMARIFSPLPIMLGVPLEESPSLLSLKF